MTEEEIRDKAEKKYVLCGPIMYPPLSKAFISGAKWMQEQQGWISVEDRLPDTSEQHRNIYSSGKILVYGIDGFDIDEYHREYIGQVLVKNGFWNDNENITHWMPLPNPPKTEIR